MFAHIPATEAAVEQLITAQRYNDALAALLVGVHQHHTLPQVAHKFLYYPVLDRQVQQLARILDAQHPDPHAPRAPSTNTQTNTQANTLIVATELGRVGGHSRVLEDLAREVPSPVIVLTEAFTGYRPGINDNAWLYETFADATVIVLPQPDLWSKCRALQTLTRQLAPQRIFYFNHHQDAIPFVGTLGHAGSRKVFVHHADHHPSLGVTLPGVTHVDVTDELAAVCSRELGAPASVLPLHVPDGGRKAFAPFAVDELSVVTSGTAIKFARDGELALQRIAQAVLAATRGRFFHIGPMDAAWLGEIHHHLQQHDTDPARFVALGAVPSLWQALAALPAHVYIGSAPVGGARAAIEAQGCGYPLAYYRAADRGSLVALDSIYADPALGWSTPAELAAVLGAVSADHGRASDAARGLYERDFSRERFRRVLDGLRD